MNELMLAIIASAIGSGIVEFAMNFIAKKKKAE